MSSPTGSGPGSSLIQTVGTRSGTSWHRSGDTNNSAGRRRRTISPDTSGSTDGIYENFNRLWDVVRKDFYSFGRLSAFSYLEYLRIMGLNLDCPTLFLRDMQGSKSHRNGLAKVLGRDDLDWHDTNSTASTESTRLR